MGDRVKRLIAAIIDWNICGLPAVAVALWMSHYVKNGGESNPLLILLLLPAVLSMPVLFVLRDAIVRGRSIGKRIFGLYIVDEATLQPLPAGKTALKNILNIISIVLPVDAIALLITGRTLGERISKVRVLGTATLERAQNGEDITPQTSVGGIVAVLVIGAVGFVAFVVILVASIFMALGAQKETEEYRIAYEYLVESETYGGLALEESDVRLNSYHGSIDNGERTVTYGFFIGSYYPTIEITLHFEDGAWVVCEECTPFS